MAARPGDRRNELSADLARWAELGLLTTDQVTAILDAERAQGSEAAARSTRRTVVAEVLGYVGAAVVAAASALLVATFWSDLETWSQLAILTMSTGLVAAGAAVLSGSTDPAVVRLTDFLWFVASAGVVAVAAVAGTDAFDLHDQNTTLLAGAAGAGWALPLLLKRRSFLLHLATFASCGVVIVGLVHQYDRAALDVEGAALWGFGVVWMTLTWGGLLPGTRAGYTLGAATSIAAAQAVVLEVTAPGLWLGLATAALLLAAGTTERSRTLSGVGVLATFAFSGQAIAHALDIGDEAAQQTGDVAAVGGILVAGVVILVTALLLARQAPSNGEEVSHAS